MDKNKIIDSNPCIKKIEKWFRFDTFTLLDFVLTDDTINPEYSANTTYYRLEEIVNFQELYYGIKYKNVTDYLLQNGYSVEDIDLFEQKRIEENQRHGRKEAENA